MSSRLVAVVLACLLPTPALAIDWPVEDGATLEVTAGTVRAQFPAPAWIARASYDESRDGTDNLRARWSVRSGLDAVAERATALISDGEHWNLGLWDFLDETFFDDCQYPLQRDIEPREDSDTLALTYALCGYDYGTGSGAMLVGISRMAGPMMFDLWYEVPLAAFQTHDETTWPMSAADFEATLRALDDLVVVRVAE